MVEWAKVVKERANYICEHCGIAGVPMHAHHLVSKGADISRATDLSNGRNLCYFCHHKVHTGEIKL